LNRALSGQVKDDWQEILEEVDDWNNVDKDEFIRMLKKLGMKTFRPKAYKAQCKALDAGKIKIPPGVSLLNGVQWFFQINKLIPYLEIYAHEYDIEGLNKVITASLPPKAYGKYCGNGGDNLDDKDVLGACWGTEELGWNERSRKKLRDVRQQSNGFENYEL